MPAYDNELFSPPAPLAKVILRNPTTRATLVDVPMLLDSGADVTLIPQFCLEPLDLAPMADQRYELMGFDGSISDASVVRLEMVFLGRVFKGQYLVIDQAWGVLGRNVLNAVSLLYDGPRLTWTESDSGGRSRAFV
jgi:hypothetical protein